MKIKTFKNLYIIDTISLTNCDYNNLCFKRETEFINGITSDFTIINNKNKTIIGIIECKREDIGVTSFVRGIGQVYQYDYFHKNKILPKKFNNYKYSDVQFSNIYALPSNFIKNTKINIGRFNYPKDLKIVEINDITEYSRLISDKELSKLAEAGIENKYVLSQYYVRDNRQFEIFMLLKYLKFMSLYNNHEKINRKELETKVLKLTNTINNGNWRNAFIEASLLGFIDESNNITNSGEKIIQNGFGNFLATLYDAYLHPMIDEIMKTLLKHCSDNSNVCELSNSELSDEISKKYGKKVLYLTDSDNRYISSWLNIMRDDYQCIDFKRGDKKRTINYVPSDLKKSVLINKLSNNKLADTYIEKIDDLIKKGKII